MTSWKQLETYFQTLLPDNILGLISPSKVRTAFSALMRAFDTVIQFALSTTVTRKIAVANPKARSWPITLSGATNTIELEAFTSITRRVLLLDENFVIIGQGTARTFQITDPYFYDLEPGEKIIYKERVKGSFDDLKAPVFTIVNQNGVNRYAFKIEGQNDDQLQTLGDVPSPYMSSAVLFNHPQLGNINVAAALQDLLDRQDKIVYTETEFLAAQNHRVPRQIIYVDRGIYYKIPGYPVIKLLTFRPTPQS